MHQLSTPEALFAGLMAREPSRPLVTYYDEATGERAELSVKSSANWVAKTHHLLGTELGLGVGATAALVLDAHWISVPVLLGCFSAGLAVTASGPAEVAFVAPGVAVAADDVYVVAPAPSGAAGDYIGAVRPQADAWATVHSPATPADPGWPGLTRGDLVEAARSRAAGLGLAAGGRLLTTRSWESPADWLDTVLAPLAVGGSVVFVVNCTDDAVIERRIQQERATARL